MSSEAEKLDKIYVKLEALEKEIRETRQELGGYIRVKYPKFSQQKTN